MLRASFCTIERQRILYKSLILRNRFTFFTEIIEVTSGFFFALTIAELTVNNIQ